MEGQAMLNAQTGTAQGQFDAYSKYLGLYSGIDSGVANQQFGASLGMYGQYSPGIDALNNASNTDYRTAAINDVANYGGTVAQQYRDLNPELYASLNSLSSAANQNLATAGGTQAGELEAMLGRQAQEQLGLGSSLSLAEQRDATQSARAAGAARGLYDSNSTIGAEILNNYALSQQRLQQRQQFAGDTATLLRSGQSQDAALAQQQFGNLATASNAWQQNAYDPYAGIFGQNSSNQLNSQQIAALNANVNAYNQQATRNQFDPYNAYAQGIYSGAYQAQANAQTDRANAMAEAAKGRSSIGGIVLGNILG